MNMETNVFANLSTSNVKGSVQHQLLEMCLKQSLVRLESLVSDADKLRWWMSHRNEESGAWLKVKPIYQKLVIPNHIYRTSLRYRCHLPNAQYVVGSKCTCNAPLDSLGHHLATGCAKGGERFITHNAVKYELNNILCYAGYYTKIEEQQLFNDNGMDGTSTARKFRPDISIINPVGSVHTRLLLDVGVTGALTGTPGSAAISYHNAKNRKYLQMSTSRGFGFLPIIFESSGMLHAEAKSFLKRVAKRASELKRISEDILFEYFLKRLSLTLQRGIAEAITQRTAKVNSHSTVESDVGYYVDVITSA